MTANFSGSISVGTITSVRFVIRCAIRAVVAAACAQSIVGTLTTSMSTSSATMLAYSKSDWNRPSSLYGSPP